MQVLTIVRAPIRGPFSRLLLMVAAALPVCILVAWAILSLTFPEVPVTIRVRWTSAVGEQERVELERHFELVDGRLKEATTWEYRLQNTATENIRALVQHERVEDTAYVDRSLFRPDVEQDRTRLVRRYSLVAGTVATFGLFLTAIAVRNPERIPLPSRTEFAAAFRSTPPLPARTQLPIGTRGFNQARVSIGVLAVAVTSAVAMWLFAEAPIVAASGALLTVYVGGYVTGSLLIDRVDGAFTPSWAVIRTVAGLLLTTVAFLASLALSLPWFVLPAAVVASAVVLRGKICFRWPSAGVGCGYDAIIATTLAVLILLPIVITALYMAPNGFPPMFFNVDTPYFLEKVHALAAADSYPPPSLSNAGGARPYHFGTQAIAAMISRATDLPPHQAVFLVVLPLLTAGVAAAAVAAARAVAPAVPLTLAVPLLLVSVPALSETFWSELGPELQTARTTPQVSLIDVVGNSSLWGILSNEGQNVGGTFLILGSLAAIAAAAKFGWRLAVFFIGVAVLVKMTTGFALVAGFALAEAWRMIRSKRLVLSPQLLAMCAVFGLIYGLFFVAPAVEPEFQLQVFFPYHLHHIAVVREHLPAFAADLLWLLLPVSCVLFARGQDREGRSAALLVMAIAPLVLVNLFRAVDVRPGMSGPDDAWLQTLHTAPFLLHAFAISLASSRWSALDRARRAAFGLLTALIFVPVVAASIHYSHRLLRDPQSGYEFVDNRPLGEALAVIPPSSALIVTNDLRYPANEFRREGRQMQIPALFGHQAFAVNYSYEVYRFSQERWELQKLLEAPQWSDDIVGAAREHEWTHFVVRKDHVHPRPIPLEQIFENSSYAVFRFPKEAGT
jgi:hypothetical protein